MEPVWINERLERINQMIEDYAKDMSLDNYNDGYDLGYSEGGDHAWDEARNVGYDEGWEDACQHILDKMITKTGFVVTPRSRAHLNDLIEQNSPIVAAALLNYLHEEIKELKVDK